MGRECVVYPLVPQLAQLVLGRAASLARLAHRSVPWWAAPFTASSLPREEKTMFQFWILDFRFWIVSPVIVWVKVKVGCPLGTGVCFGAPAGPLWCVDPLLRDWGWRL